MHDFRYIALDAARIVSSDKAEDIFQIVTGGLRVETLAFHEQSVVRRKILPQRPPADAPGQLPTYPRATPSSSGQAFPC